MTLLASTGKQAATRAIGTIAAATLSLQGIMMPGAVIMLHMCF